MALLKKKIKSLMEEVLWLEDRLKLTGKRSEIREAEAPKPKERPAAKSTSIAATPKPGKIIEQEISE